MTDGSPPVLPAPWPWDRLLVFGLGCVSASIGAYVVIFHAFQESFGIDASIMPNAYAWGTAAIILGIVLLTLPWFKGGPLARRWKKYDDYWNNRSQ